MHMRLAKVAAVLVGLFMSVSAYATETCSKSEPSRPNGDLPMCLALDAVVTTGASSTVDTFSFRYVNTQIWSAAGSVATVDIECRSSESAPWFPCYTTSNPSAAGKYVTLPRAYQYRANVSAWTSGSVSVTFERYNY